jgi:hypothetical protein
MLILHYRLAASLDNIRQRRSFVKLFQNFLYCRGVDFLEQETLDESFVDVHKAV